MKEISTHGNTEKLEDTMLSSVRQPQKDKGSMTQSQAQREAKLLRQWSVKPEEMGTWGVKCSVEYLKNVGARPQVLDVQYKHI